MTAKVAILTHIPSPYQVEFFDGLAASGRLRPRVIYARRSNPARRWQVPALHHEHVFHGDGEQAGLVARNWISDSDLVVVSYYSDRPTRKLMRARAASGRPWCLWGERPGGRWGPVGRLRRRVYLSDLATSHAPIWGIGVWAIDGWRREFGNRRRYENVPYFSDLERFRTAAAAERCRARTFLFSGSLIPRKGVDLAADAFVRIARERPDVQFHILGTGPLEDRLRVTLAHVRERVTFLGFRPWSELPAIYRTADVLCAPSRYDGWGLIVPEGLATGLPVIATDRMGAAVDLIRPQENGWITQAGCIASLEQAMLEAATVSDDRLSAMRQEALKTAATHSLESGVMRFCEATESAVADAMAWASTSQAGRTTGSLVSLS